MVGSIWSIAIVGYGNLGQQLATSLLQSGAQVTILSRDVSKMSSPFLLSPNITTKEVNYKSRAALESVLRGIDVVVSTLNVFSDLYEKQKMLIDASIVAKVRRFIPSDFSLCLEDKEVGKLPFFEEKHKTHLYLSAKAEKGEIEFTSINSGTFIDLALESGRLVNMKAKSAKIYDGGDMPVPGTRMATVVQSINRSIMEKWDQTRNKVIRIQEVVFTQNQLLKIGKQLVGKGESWTIMSVSTEESMKEALEKYEAGDRDQFVYTSTVARVMFGFGCQFAKNDNDLLGIEEIGEERLKALINEALHHGH